MQIEFDNQRHCADFIRLNEEWISAHFSLEESDQQLAADPFRIVRDGGHIISLVEDERVVGVCALLKESEQRYQLARMAVEPAARGRGYGDVLMRAALDRARARGASSVYLLTNKVLAPAVALYRKHGFETVEEGPHPVYARCNIVMEMRWREAMPPDPPLPEGCVMRRAVFADLPQLETLIAQSARELSAGDYSDAQVEGALRGAFGVDTQLLRDGTYFVVEHSSRLVACGGWSRRRTLFGGDARPDRDAAELDPRVDAAKIRAFFIHPDFARRGLGTAILDRCEGEAVAHGFSRFELMATLPGVRLYGVRGYVAATPIEWPLGDGVTIRFVPMTKLVSADVARAAASRSGRD